MVYWLSEVHMNFLQITNEGKLSIQDYKSVYRVILEELWNGPLKILELISRIRVKHIEFKYMKPQIFVGAIGELVNQKLVISMYEEEY
jgi:hypothetical protein